MRRIFLVSMLFLIVSIFAFAQVSVNVNPQILPPGAPFEVMVDSDLSGISSVVVTFNGTSSTSVVIPSFFTFYAPKLVNGQATNATVHVKVFTKDGKEYQKSLTLHVSNNANPVVIMKKPRNKDGKKFEKNFISGNVYFPVEIYGGVGISEIDFMVDSTIESSQLISSSSPIGLYNKKFEVRTGKLRLKNGWHVFSIKVVSVTHQIFSKTVGYIVNNELPLIEFQKLGKCLAASTNVTINVTAKSTLSGISEVMVMYGNTQKNATRESTDSWSAYVTTPKKSGELAIKAVAIDNSMNESSKTVKVFIDGKRPTIKLSNDAKKINSTYWKRKSPLTFTVKATSGSEYCGIKPLVEVKAVNSKGIVVSTNTKMIKIATPDTYTISASVVDPVNELTDSTVAKFTFKIDNTPPVIKSIKLLPKEFKIDDQTIVGPSSTITVTVVATDGTGVGIAEIIPLPKVVGRKIGSDTWSFTNYNSQLHPGLNELPLKLTVLDRLGNSASIDITKKVFVDNKSPTIKVTIPNDSIYKNGTYWKKVSPFCVNYKITTDSGVKPKYEIIVNGIENPSTTICLKHSGVFKITVVATNPVNDLSTETSTTLKIRFDDQSPDIKSIELSPNKFKKDGQIIIGPNRRIRVSVKTTDNGIGIQNIFVNGKTAKKVSDDEYVTTLMSPSNLKMSDKWPIKIVTKDYLGNSTKVGTSVFLDVKPPTITCRLVPSVYYNRKNKTYWNNKTPFIVLVDANTNSGVKASIVSKLNGKSFDEATLVRIAGTYRLTVVATNPVNALSTRREKTWKLGFDKTPPKITKVTVPATVGPDARILVKASVTDKGIGVYGVWANNKPMSRGRDYDNVYSATLTIPSSLLTSEYWPIKIHAVDVFGNGSNVATRIFIDMNPPKISLYLNDKKLKNGSDRVFYFSKAPILRYSAYTDGKEKAESKMYLDCGKETQNSVKISGTHFVTVVSTDPTNGKATELKVKFSVVVENGKPIVKITPPNKISATSAAQVKVSIEDRYLKYALLTVKSQNDSLLYAKVYGQGTTTTVDLRRAFSEINGQNVTIDVMAEDINGKISNVSSKNLYVDTVPPYIKSVKINKDGDLVVTFSEKIYGKPMVKIYSNGNSILEKEGTISENLITIHNVGKKLPKYTVYKVEIQNVMDKVGNTIGNNASSWEF